MTLGDTSWSHEADAGAHTGLGFDYGLQWQDLFF